ncbi:MAG: HD domain protein [Parcubacteria group bacterium GW2011_GWC2_39_14]|nr:MAG: HD domain protein [Parcubacteria group bacterium GW2011_GWC2_39_14]KKR55399.1 MAG: HD domain protein [Parcubacteria group bacterium GW2011_GWA2_40_23]
MTQLSFIEEVTNHKKQSNMKDKFIKDLQAGDQVANFLAVVRDIKKGKTSQNKDFIDLILADRTGEITAKIWEDNLNNCDEFEIGDIISLGGKVNEFKEKNQLIISFLQKAQNQETADFLPGSEKDLEALFKTILKQVDSIENDDLKKLVNSFFKDEKFIEKFKKAPAAERIHHAYVGGFVEHVSEMLALAECLCASFTRIDKDLLKTGVLLHDIGKLDELDVNHTIFRTVDGALIGHLMLGTIAVSKAIESIKDFPDLLKTKVLHLIASHHGRLEFGSPVLPQTREAVALNHLDDLSTKVNVADKAIFDNQGSPADFSDRIFALDTKLFLN